MDKLLRLHALLRKEMTQLLKNRQTRAMLFVPIITQLVVLGYAATMDLKHVDFGVLDYSRTAASRSLVRKFSGSTVFTERVPIKSEAELRKRLDCRNIRLGLVIPQNFEKELTTGRSVDVALIVDGRNSNTAGLIIGYASSIIENFNRSLTVSNPVTVKTRGWFNPNFDSQYFMVPIILAIVSLLDMILVAALGIAKEREAGTFDQLMLTPFRPDEILLTKTLSNIMIGLIQLSLGLLIVRIWFRIPLNSSYGLLYLMFVSFLVASSGIGMMISVLSGTQQKALLLAMFTGLPLMTISGMVSPVETMPKFFRILTLFNPIRHGIDVLHRIFLEGCTLVDILPSFLMLWGIGLSMLTGAWLIFVHKRT